MTILFISCVQLPKVVAKLHNVAITLFNTPHTFRFLCEAVANIKNSSNLSLKCFHELVSGHYKTDTSDISSHSTGYNTRHRHALSVCLPRTIIEWNNLSNKAVTQNSVLALEFLLRARCILSFFFPCIYLCSPVNVTFGSFFRPQLKSCT